MIVYTEDSRHVMSTRQQFNEKISVGTMLNYWSHDFLIKMHFTIDLLTKELMTVTWIIISWFENFKDEIATLPSTYLMRNL